VDGWRSGLSFGAKPRELPKLSNHSTLQAYREDKGGKSGVVARSGGCSREEACEQGQGGAPEWRHKQDPEASSEELSCHDPSSLDLSLHTRPPHA
jgi:hypothetical protein